MAPAQRCNLLLPVLQVKQVVVLGYANCGGIRALMESDGVIQSDGFIDSWMNLAAKAKKEVRAREDLKTIEQRIDACEKTAVGHSLNNLMTYPWISERVAKGSLNLVGCYYDLRNGELIALEEIN